MQTEKQVNTLKSPLAFHSFPYPLPNSSLRAFLLLLPDLLIRPPIIDSNGTCVR